MKKVKVISFLIIGVCSVMLAGCNKDKEVVAEEAVVETAVVETEENMFGLTESEQRMYAEYAAGVLMKYNAGSNMRILEGKTLIDQEAKEQEAKEQADKRAQLAAEYEANKNNKKEEQNSGDNSSKGTGLSYITDMAQATGTDAFSIVYDGYEITDSYPNSGDDILMAMDATAGKLLFVTKYKVTNISGQPENLDMFSKQGKFRLSLNGKRYKSQYTLLLNDLSMYKGEVGAGETVEGVLIFEIPEAEASDVNDLVLSITVDGESSSMQLQGGTVMWTESVEETEEVFSAEDTLSEEEEADESSQESEYNDLAEEYMNALEAENAGINYNESSSVSDDGNVTIVGSQRN